MSEPRLKRIKTCLPLCKAHLSTAGSQVRQNFPTVVEESLCGVSTLLMEVSYRLEALVRRTLVYCKHDSYIITPQIIRVVVGYCRINYIYLQHCFKKFYIYRVLCHQLIKVKVMEKFGLLSRCDQHDKPIVAQKTLDFITV